MLHGTKRARATPGVSKCLLFLSVPAMIARAAEACSGGPEAPEVRRWTGTRDGPSVAWVESWASLKRPDELRVRQVSTG